MGPAKKQTAKNTRSIQARSQQSPVKQKKLPELNINHLPLEFQQQILDIFRRTFPFDSNTSDLRSTIQEVKGHLFQRDFARAFAKSEYLDAYALRWSAGRALGYTSVFVHGDLRQVWAAYAGVASNDTLPGEPLSHASACKVLCIGGGGGAEVVACAAAARTNPLSCKVEVHVVDIADWSRCLSKIESTLYMPPQLSAHAGEHVKAANKPFIESDTLDVNFSQHDILAMPSPELNALLQDVHLCTMMFTLNELFTTSIAKATAFLLSFTSAMNPGSWLLVVDSPGSYSEVKLGSSTKQYPMKWLLDHTLLELAGGDQDENNRKWKKVVSDDSRWFRLEKSDLKYPIELENMRYQIHLYQRVEGKDLGN